jgi:ABC-type thiamine transport system ATPase subunit
VCTASRSGTAQREQRPAHLVQLEGRAVTRCAEELALRPRPSLAVEVEHREGVVDHGVGPGVREIVGAADPPATPAGPLPQRVAIAGALVTRPRIVLADEPTVSLDSANGKAIIELMKEPNQVDRTTFISSTHDPSVMAKASPVIRLVDGRIADDGLGGAPAPRS